MHKPIVRAIHDSVNANWCLAASGCKCHKHRHFSVGYSVTAFIFCRTVRFRRWIGYSSHLVFHLWSICFQEINAHSLWPYLYAAKRVISIVEPFRRQFAARAITTFPYSESRLDYDRIIQNGRGDYPAVRRGGGAGGIAYSRPLETKHRRATHVRPFERRSRR